jgi:hypothetical protein
MRVFELESDITKNFFYIVGDRPTICRSGLYGLFVIPKDTDKIWISVRKSPAKNFVEAKLKRNIISSSKMDSLIIDKKNISVVRQVTRLLAIMKIYHNDTFYFKVEY